MNFRHAAPFSRKETVRGSAARRRPQGAARAAGRRLAGCVARRPPRRRRRRCAEPPRTSQRAEVDAGRVSRGVGKIAACARPTITTKAARKMHCRLFAIRYLSAQQHTRHAGDGARRGNRERELDLCAGGGGPRGHTERHMISFRSGVISVREPGKRGEQAACHRVDGPRQRNLQQDASRAGAARELQDEVVRHGRGRGA